MKILKPGKVEQRKFVCPKCGCVFIADETEICFPRALNGKGIWAVDCVCGERILWDNGEPYEEPVQDTQSHRKRLADLIDNAPVQRSAPWDEKRLQIADYMIAHGVTFRKD